MHQVSETVTFEEIADTRAGEPKIRPNVKMESQISDVEWEDIR